MNRVFGLSICREEDKKWLHDTISAISIKSFKIDEDNLFVDSPVIFSSIAPHSSNQNNLSNKISPSLNTMPSVTLYCIHKWKSIEETIQYYITRYQEEGLSTVPIKLELSDDNLHVIASLHRALKQTRCIYLYTVHTVMHIYMYMHNVYSLMSLAHF